MQPSPHKIIAGNASLLDSALGYAASGWPVLPLHAIKGGHCTCNKSCRSPGKHPRTRNGLKDATVNTGKISQWWKQWPDANIGILTGSASGLIVLDVDPRNGGDHTLSGLLSDYGSLPETLETETGGGGSHILFAYPDISVKGGNGKLGPGLDVKSDGGYIVAPPSNHASGGMYQWRTENPIQPLSGWLLSRLNGHQAIDVGQGISEGSRNDTLVSLGGKLRAQGKRKRVIEAELLDANSNHCSPPLDESEVLKIAQSVCRYKKGETRPVHIWRDLIRSEDGPKSSTIRHILIDLGTFMDGDGGNCYPTQDTLEKTTGIYIKTISKHLKQARLDGWIKIIGHKGEGQAWRNHVYRPRLPDKVVAKHHHLIRQYWPQLLEGG
jgi:hypothetical protein